MLGTGLTVLFFRAVEPALVFTDPSLLESLQDSQLMRLFATAEFYLWARWSLGNYLWWRSYRAPAWAKRSRSQIRIELALLWVAWGSPLLAIAPALYLFYKTRNPIPYQPFISKQKPPRVFFSSIGLTLVFQLLIYVIPMGVAQLDYPARSQWVLAQRVSGLFLQSAVIYTQTLATQASLFRAINRDLAKQVRALPSMKGMDFEQRAARRERYSALLNQELLNPKYSDPSLHKSVTPILQMLAHTAATGIEKESRLGGLSKDDPAEAQLIARESATLVGLMFKNLATQSARLAPQPIWSSTQYFGFTLLTGCNGCLTLSLVEPFANAEGARSAQERISGLKKKWIEVLSKLPESELSTEELALVQEFAPQQRLPAQDETAKPLGLDGTLGQEPDEESTPSSPPENDIK